MDDDCEYWVEISQYGVRLGAGFLLARRLVLTALHCLDDCAPGNDEVELSFATGRKLSGRVCERAHGADLALIMVTEASGRPTAVPSPDRGASGDTWRAPYRPSNADPFLGGEIQSGSMLYQSAKGDAIEALQLGCTERIGDYSGYSGGPVERDLRDGSRGVIGILIEQYPDRQQPERASDVLFAATIAEALRRFEHFDVLRLFGVLYPQSGGPDTRPPEGDWKAVARDVFATVREWVDGGLLDPGEVPQLHRRIASRAIDKAFQAAPCE